MKRAEIRATQVAKQEAVHQQHSAATKLQSIQRGRNDRAKFKAKNEAFAKKQAAKEELWRRQDAAARMIQRLVRGKLGRNAFARKIIEVAELSSQRNGAATKMQALFRGTQGRGKANERKSQVLREEAVAGDVLDTAATKIQCTWRGHKGGAAAQAQRELLAIRAGQTEEERRKAEAELAAEEAAKAKADALALAESQESAALTLQCTVRGRQARLKVGRIRGEREGRRAQRDKAKREALEHKSAVHIQKLVLEFLGKCRDAKLRDIYAEEERQLEAQGEAGIAELELMRNRHKSMLGASMFLNKATASHLEHEAEIADETHMFLLRQKSMLSQGLSEDEIVDKSAMQLQSLFRGNLARKSLAENQEGVSAAGKRVSLSRERLASAEEDAEAALKATEVTNKTC